MSGAVNVIAEGEVLQLMNVNDPDITEENYMRVIYSKLRACLKRQPSVPAFWPDCTEAQEKACRTYGLPALAFQLIDDLLDYSADGETLGQKRGR